MCTLHLVKINPVVFFDIIKGGRERELIAVIQVGDGKGMVVDRDIPPASLLLLTAEHECRAETSAWEHGRPQQWTKASPKLMEYFWQAYQKRKPY